MTQVSTSSEVEACYKSKDGEWWFNYKNLIVLNYEEMGPKLYKPQFEVTITSYNRNSITKNQYNDVCIKGSNCYIRNIAELKVKIIDEKEIILRLEDIKDAHSFEKFCRAL